MDRFKRLLPFLRPVLIVALFAISLRLLQDVLARYRYRDVVHYLESLPPAQVLLSIVLTLVGYFLMTGYDSLQVAQDALTSGANAYLPKPFDLMHLDRLITEAIGSEDDVMSSAT